MDTPISESGSSASTKEMLGSGDDKTSNGNDGSTPPLDASLECRPSISTPEVSGESSSEIKRRKEICRLCPNRIVGQIPPCDNAEMQDFIWKISKKMELADECPDGSTKPILLFCHECYPVMLRLWELRGAYENVTKQLADTIKVVEKREERNEPGCFSKKPKIQPQPSKLKNLLMDVCKETFLKSKEGKAGGEDPAGGSVLFGWAGRLEDAPRNQGGDLNPAPEQSDGPYIVPVQVIKEEVPDWDYKEVDYGGPAELSQLGDIKQEVEEADFVEEEDDDEDGTGLPLYVMDPQKQKTLKYNGVQIRRVFGTGAHADKEFLECGTCGHLVPYPKPYNKRASPFKAMRAHVEVDHTKEAGLAKPRRATEPVCLLCFKTFSNLKELQEHKAQHPPEALPECDICRKPFPKGTGLVKIMAHKFSHKNDEEREAAVAASEPGTDHRRLANKIFGKAKSGESPRKQKQEIAPPSPKDAGSSKKKEIAEADSGKKKDIPKVDEPSPKDALICNFCGRKFKRQCYLTNHLKIHGVFPSSSQTGKDQKRAKNKTAKREGIRKSSRGARGTDSIDVGGEQAKV